MGDAEMMECDTTVLVLRKAGKKIKEIAEITGLSYNEVNYRLLVLAKNGMIERRRKKLGRIGLSREDFADVIAETEDMRARGEI